MSNAELLQPVLGARILRADIFYRETFCFLVSAYQDSSISIIVYINFIDSLWLILTCKTSLCVEAHQPPQKEAWALSRAAGQSTKLCCNGVVSLQKLPFKTEIKQLSHSRIAFEHYPLFITIQVHSWDIPPGLWYFPVWSLFQQTFLRSLLCARNCAECRVQWLMWNLSGTKRTLWIHTREQ